MKDKLSLVHIGQFLGGVQTSIELINAHLNPVYFNITVICGENDFGKTLYDKHNKKIEVFEIKLKREIGFKDIIAFVQIVSILQKIRPDVVHCHSAKGGFLGRFACAILDIPCFYTPQAFSYLSTKSKLKRQFFIFLEKIVRGDSYLLACSPSEAVNGKNIVGYKDYKIRVWSNSISSVENLILGVKNPFEHLKPYFCTIGRPSYQKNSIQLVLFFERILSILPESKLVIVGVGHYSPLKKRLKDLITIKRLDDKIILIDWVERPTALRILNDAFCYLSLARYEGLPYAIIESFSLGVPVIASNVDGNRDCINDGSNGFLIDLNNLDPSVNRVEGLKDPLFYKDLRKNAYLTFIEDFDIEKNIINLEEIYKGVLKK